MNKKPLSRIKYNEQWNVWVSTEGLIYRQLPDGTLKEFSRSVTNSGYYQVGFLLNGKCCVRLVHRLVAETFLNNPNNLRDVDHIDNDKLNNTLENLRFATHSFNCLRNERKMSTEHREKMREASRNAHLGKKWYTDGVRNVIGNPGECPEGFYLGYTKSRKGQGHYNIKPARECIHEEKIA